MDAPASGRPPDIASAMPSAAERDRLLRLDDAALARLCRVERCRGTGPGGQKRNKTASAVTVTHPPSGIAGASDETRSQHTNLRLALRHLRLALALQWRAPPVAPERWPFAEPPSRRADDYPHWVACLLDQLAAQDWRLAEAARACRLSTGRLVRLLAAEPALWQAVNRARTAAGLPALRAGD
jgi:hypothetical protein